MGIHELLEEPELVNQEKGLDFSVFCNNGVRDVPWHCHGHVEILYLVRGHCRLILHERQLQMKAGELMVLAIWEPHRLEAEQPCDFLVVQCSRGFFLRDEPEERLFSLYQTLLCGESPMSQPVVPSEAETWMDALIRENSEKLDGYETVIRGLIFQLLISVYRLGALPGADLRWEQDTDRREFLKLLYWVQGKLGRSLSPGEAAKRMNVSTSHFSRLFRDRTGQGFCAYVSDQRIRKARGLLLTGGLSVTDVALECGFSDSAYFSRVFRKKTEMSPLQFRERNCLIKQR